jgi:hypothetical protein
VKIVSRSLGETGLLASVRLAVLEHTDTYIAWVIAASDACSFDSDLDGRLTQTLRNRFALHLHAVCSSDAEPGW